MVIFISLSIHDAWKDFNPDLLPVRVGYSDAIDEKIGGIQPPPDLLPDRVGCSDSAVLVICADNPELLPLRVGYSDEAAAAVWRAL